MAFTNNLAAVMANMTAGNLSSMSAGSVSNATLKGEAAIDKAAKDFEAIFLGQMMSQMFGESTGEEMFGDSDSNEIYRGMMMEQYGQQISKAGGIGIADYLKRELLKAQEV